MTDRKATPTARERFEKLKNFVNGTKQDKYATRITLPLFELDFVISLVELAVGYAGEEIYTKYVNLRDEKAAQEFVWGVIEQRLSQGEGKV